MQDLLETFAELRPLLFSIAYRMTGTRADAEDVLQEAYLRYRQASARVAIESPKAFLSKTVSRLALDTLKAAHRKRELYVGPWLPEPIVGPAQEPAELAESLSIAFLHLMESLQPAERAAFLLREIFDTDYAEVAATLDTSEANARQLVSRAKQHLRSRRATPRARVEPQQHQQLLGVFVTACAEGDATKLAAVLREDAVLYSDGGGRVRAALNPIYGADRIIRFVLGLRKKGIGTLSGFAALVNGEPGVVLQLDGVPYAIQTIAVDQETGRIGRIYAIMNPDKLTSLRAVPGQPS